MNPYHTRCCCQAENENVGIRLGGVSYEGGRYSSGWIGRLGDGRLSGTVLGWTRRCVSRKAVTLSLVRSPCRAGLHTDGHLFSAGNGPDEIQAEPAHQDNNDYSGYDFWNHHPSPLGKCIKYHLWGSLSILYIGCFLNFYTFFCHMIEFFRSQAKDPGKIDPRA